MAPKAPFKGPAKTGGPQTTEIVPESPTAAPGNTGGQGGGGDPDDDSGTPVPDSNAQPPSSDGTPFASAHESPSPPGDDASGRSEEPPAALEGADKPSGDNEESGPD